MLTYYIDGDAAGGGNGTQGSPYNSGNATPQTGGLYADSVTLYIKAGATNPVVFNAGGGFRPPNGGTLTLRAYGGGARPVITCTGKGFLTNGAGSMLDVQDVEIRNQAGTNAGLQACTGGGLTVSRAKLLGWKNQLIAGSGTVLIEDSEFLEFAWNGILIDVQPAYNLGSNGIIRRNTVTSRQIGAAGQDPLVLHDGGIGLGTGWLVEDNTIYAANPQAESGLDIQQQFKGCTVRRNKVYGATQWGYGQGDLFQNQSRAFATKTQMLAFYNREKFIGNPVLANNSNVINGGHCAWVTGDGANNGLYQLTGNDPREASAWTGPMTADDLLAVPTLVHENLIVGHGGGFYISHPGTQLVANVARGITQAHGACLNLRDMAYGCQVWDNDFDVSGGAASTRPIIVVNALEPRIAARTRAKLRNNKATTDGTVHTGPYITFSSAADLGYLDSDYCSFARPSLTSEFALVGSTPKTFAQYKAANGGSDANSLHITTADALLDAEGRLLEDSPLIGAGTARSGLDAGIPSVDVEGNAVSSPPDIGAYRYLSSAEAADLMPTPRRAMRAQRVPPDPLPAPGEVPGAITGLTLVSAGATTLSFSWDPEPNAGYYELSWSLAGAGDWTTADEHFADESGAVTVPAALTDYDVRVRGVSSAGDGPWTEPAVLAATAAAVWFRPQDSADTAGFAGMPALVAKYQATGAQSNPGAYADPDVYTLFADNGGAGGGVALIAVDDDAARRMNAVLTMVGMAAGRQILIGQRASHEDDGVRSLYFCYGSHASASSCYGLQISSAGDMGFLARGLGAGNSTVTTLTKVSGPDYDEFNGQGGYVLLLSIRAVSTIAVDVELRIIHETVGTSVWTGSAIDCSEGTDPATLPGITSGQTAGGHGGLMLGGLMRSSSANYAPDVPLGRGVANAAALADFQAVVLETYNSAHVDAAETAVLSDPTGWWLG